LIYDSRPRSNERREKKVAKNDGDRKEGRHEGRKNKRKEGRGRKEGSKEGTAKASMQFVGVSIVFLGEGYARGERTVRTQIYVS